MAGLRSNSHIFLCVAVCVLAGEQNQTKEPGALTDDPRQLLGQPVVRSPVVLQKRYNSGEEYKEEFKEEYREPADWKKAIEANRFGLWIELPQYLEFSGQNVRRNNL